MFQSTLEISFKVKFLPRLFSLSFYSSPFLSLPLTDMCALIQRAFFLGNFYSPQERFSEIYKDIKLTRPVISSIFHTASLFFFFFSFFAFFFFFFFISFIPMFLSPRIQRNDFARWSLALLGL